MQFKNPEILYFLFLLIIPILIHLFQLQKFQKVAFTNVKFLKQIEQQTRKSSKLKKLLLLISRLLIFTFLIMAFSQPYFSRKENNLKIHTYIYLDNSLSMQAKGKKGELLQKAKHDLIDRLKSTENSITLITNDNIIIDIQSENFKNEILNIDYYPIKKNINTVLLELNNLKNKNPFTENNIILISDFQEINDNVQAVNLDSSSTYVFVQQLPEKHENIALDSVWVSEFNSANIKIKANLRSYNATVENMSISLSLNDNLFGRSTVNLNENETKEIEFSIPYSNELKGIISLNDNRLAFDNNLFFSLSKQEKINVLAIGKGNEFLSKIYTEDEFLFISTTLEQLDYNSIFNQNLVLVNELTSFPNSLLKSLHSFVSQGGRLVIIPSEKSDTASYNELFSLLNIGRMEKINEEKKSITTINFDHPFFKDVFQKKVTNFQYPFVNRTFDTKLINSSSILQFNDQSDFISKIKIKNSSIYWVSSPLNFKNSNFKSSVLVVPVFYNFGLNFGKKKDLYYTIGRKNNISVFSKDKNDGGEVLQLSKGDINFIPLQIKTANKIIVRTENNPTESGLYLLKNNTEIFQQVAFNYNREESNLVYQNMKSKLKNLENVAFSTSVTNAIVMLNDKYKKHQLWQLFLIFALIFLGMEIVLQKFL